MYKESIISSTGQRSYIVYRKVCNLCRQETMSPIHNVMQGGPSFTILATNISGVVDYLHVDRT